MKMTHNKHWLALHHAPSLSGTLACELVTHYGDAKTACAASVSELRARGVSNVAAHFLHHPNGERKENHQDRIIKNESDS